MIENELKTKSFWERPEGTTGMVTIAAIIGGLWLTGDFFIGLFNKAITMLGQAITITVLGAILFGIVMILSNKKFQTLVSYGFKSIMRKITGAFVEIDPIGIMKSYVQDLRGKQATMEESIGKLRGQISVCEAQVNKNDAAYQTEMSRAKVAQEKDMKSAFTVASRQAGRLEKLNKQSLVPLLSQMQVHLRALLKYKEVTGTVIDDLNNEVKAREIEREMMMTSHSVMSTAKKIINGGTDQKELFDQAMEFVVNDYGMKMGEIENFIENSKGFVEGLDLQNGVYEAEAAKKLAEWENKADSILLGSTGKAQMLEQSQSSYIDMNIGAPAAELDYARFLNRDDQRK